MKNLFYKLIALVFIPMQLSVLAQGYKLPFLPSTTHTCTAGNHGNGHHDGIDEYAFDFSMPIGTPICATKSGKIVEKTIYSGWNDGNCVYPNCSDCVNKVNRIVIDHLDGTYSLYMHLTNTINSPVSINQTVEQGQIIGYSGNSGCSTGPHLHFMVMNNYPNWYQQSIQISFIDYSNNSGVPISGSQCTSGSLRIPNQSLPIYAGTKATPKTFELFFLKTEVNNEIPNLIKNIKINGVALNTSSITVPQVRSSHITSSQVVYSCIITPTSSAFNNLNDNNSYNFSCDVTTTNNKTYSFTGSNQFYLKKPDALDASIGSGGDWIKEYVHKGISAGIFTGSGVSGTTFNASSNLSRAEAAKVIVAATIGSRVTDRIMNTTNANNDFSDFNNAGNSDVRYSYPYALTLKNWGVIGSATNFNPKDPITVRDFCRWIDLAMKFNASDENNLNGNSRVVVSIPSSVGNAANLQASMQRMNKILVNSGTDIINPNDKIEPIFTTTDFSTVPATYYFQGNIVTDGAGYVTRAKMAKVITNAYIFAYKKYNNAYPNLRQSGNSQANRDLDVADAVTIGDKFENADITTGNPLTILSNQTYTVASGGSVNIGAGADYDEYGNPLQYYWSMVKNGATLTSNATSHRSITFTAPTVTSATTWRLYSYKANNKGKSFERIITVNVGGTSGTVSAPPTQQAHSLTLYGATANSINASWTRGNGQYCLVTCYEVQANAQDVPDPNVIYTGNNNFNNASTIFNGSETKVVYAGTGNNVTIIGLNPNTQYQVAVFEYNGNTNSTVKYNVSNPPLSRLNTLNNVIINPIADFIWLDDIQQSGQTYTFTNTSQNANSYLWSILPNATISNSTSPGSTNITFLTSGQHVLTLKATNTATGQYSTRTHNFYVYNSNELLADLQPASIDFVSPVIGGQNLTMNCYINNNSSNGNSEFSQITFAISTDAVFDENDYFIGQETYDVQAGQSVSVTHNAQIPNTFSGNYHIVAKVDYWSGITNGLISESNENNNTISKIITIQQALPDLAALSLSATPNTVSSGQTFSATGTFKNIGLGDAQSGSVLADFYISNDNNLSIDDQRAYGNLFVDAIRSANSGVVSASSNNIKLPYDLPNGNYYLICAVDFSFYGKGMEYNFNVETNEDNNWVAIPITVSNINQPTINANNYTINNISDTSMQVRWTRGNGDGCIVLARANSDLPYLTIDGNTYTANSNFPLANGIRGYYVGSSNISIDNYPYIKVVYNGTGNSVTVTGLVPNETYSFVILEYKGNGTNIDYNQITPFKGISAHTKGQNSPSSFIRIFGTIISGTSNSNYSPSSIKFFDQNNGVFFRNYNGIGKTNDGGLTWKFISNRILEKHKEDYLNGSSWLDDGHGWFCYENGNIISTTDFGYNWSEKSLDRGINDVFFVNSNIGYLALKGLVNSSVKDGAIYKSTDGGNTWNSVGVFPRPIKSIYFLNDQLGWATTYPSTGMNSIVLKTTNGGQTWSQALLNTNNYSELVEIYFINQNNGFAISLNGQVFKTTDGGSSWSEENIFNIQTTINSYSRIDFVNSQVGFINLQNKKIAKTIDGGNSWTVYSIHNDFPNPIEGQIAEIDALSENIVYVGGISGLLKSTTGGPNNLIDLQPVQSFYCAGATINLPYNITGLYDATNNFNVELSNSIGSFTTPIILQTFSNAGNGTLNVSLPINISQGSGYKIRIVSTNPSITSDTTNSFTINASPNIAVILNRNPAGSICACNAIAFIANPSNGGVAPFYQWEINGINVGTNSNFYSSTQLKDGDIVWVEMKSNITCASQTPVVSTPITVSVITIDTPFIQAIDNVLAASTDVGVQWYFNGNPITGATSQFYEATQSGNYQVRVTQNGCFVSSSVYNHSLIITGVKDNFINDNLISIFPNPSNGTFTVKMDNTIAKNVQLAIYDIEGKVVYQQQLTKQQTDIATQNLASGVYIINIQLSENEIVKHKLVIVK